jgi:iron complex transport system substrate-binding protein
MAIFFQKTFTAHLYICKNNLGFFLKKLVILIAIILSLVHCSDSKSDKSIKKHFVIDDLNRKVFIEKEPQKVISLAPNLTEILFDLELGKKIVGNTTYCNFPEDAKKITKVGDLLSVDYEKILSLKPDLIFITTEGNTKIVYDKLLALKQKVFVLNPQNFSDIKKNYLTIAKIFNREKSAQEKINSWKAIEDSIKIISENSPKSKAMFLVSSYPVILAGGKTFINEYLKILNLENIANDSKVMYPVFSREEILRRNPDIILSTTHSESNDNFFEKYAEWKNLKAVKNKNVFYLNPDIYFRPGPRYIEALKDLHQKIRESVRY